MCLAHMSQLEKITHTLQNCSAFIKAELSNGVHTHPPNLDKPKNRISAPYYVWNRTIWKVPCWWVVQSTYFGIQTKIGKIQTNFGPYFIGNSG